MQTNNTGELVDTEERGEVLLAKQSEKGTTFLKTGKFPTNNFPRVTESTYNCKP